MSGNQNHQHAPELALEPKPTNGNAEAQRMLDLFASFGVEHFNITHIHLDGEKRGFRANRSLQEVKTSMPYLLDSAPRRQNSVIIRPHQPPADVLVQLDDLTDEQYERVRPAAFLMLRTSPKGKQAWVCIEGTDKDIARRLRKGTGADPSASASVRIAGSLNYKPDYAPEFPIITMEESRPGHKMTKAQLESMGLLAPEEPKPDLSALRCSDTKERRGWPDYARCLEESTARDRKRTSADFTFCCIAIDLYRHSPEATAAKLMEVSTKAQENGRDYASGQAQRAAEKVALNPRRRF
jgi:hypothetical protein